MSALVEWGRRKAALLGSTELGDSGTGTGPWASFLPQSPCSPVRGLEDLWTTPHALITSLSLVQPQYHQLARLGTRMPG